uniref:F-box domain-containing protein n=1 Tax=Meloidogyne incognita TaxID=6306 RepID=A0A914LSR4_MELIC
MNLPLETTLDVLKFLNFNQITSLKLTNSIFLCLIDEFEKVLPQMVFKELSLISVSNDELKEYKCIEPKYLSLKINYQQRKNV